MVDSLRRIRDLFYLLTMIYRLTLFSVAVPIQNITAVTVTPIIVDHGISSFGVSATILRDRGTQFESILFNEIMELLSTWQL